MKRSTTIVAILCLSSLALLAGCGDWLAPKQISPVSGKELTATEMLSESYQEKARLDRERSTAMAEAQKRLRELRAQAVIDAQKLEMAIQDVLASADMATANVDQQVELTKTLYDGAFDALERKSQQQAAAWSFVSNIPGVRMGAAGVGIDMNSLGVLLGTVGGSSGVTAALAAWRGGRKKKADDEETRRRENDLKAKAEAEYVLGLADANAARDKADALFDEGQKTLLMLLANPSQLMPQAAQMARVGTSIPNPQPMPTAPMPLTPHA